MSGDPERADATLAWLRVAHPEARFSALDPETQPVPVPETLALPPTEPLAPDSPTGLAAIDPADRVAVVRAYERARNVRVSVAAARLLAGDKVHVHFMDLRDTHGVVLIATVPDDGSLPEPDAEDDTSMAPRVTWSRLDSLGTVLEMDEASVKLFGWPADEVIGRPALPLLHPDDHDRALENWIDVLSSPGEQRRYRVRHLRREGGYLWLDVTNHNRLDDPEHGDVLARMVDVSEEMSVHETLREREQLLRTLTDTLPVGVLQFDIAGATVHENEQLRAIVGASGLDGLLAAVAEQEVSRLGEALAAVLGGREREPVEVHLAGERVCRVTLRPLPDGGGIACVDDVTEASQLRRQLEVRATFDQLTACFSRSAILGALEHATVEQPGTGVVFVDLDRFKPVNDELGHAAGDELLAEIGERLRDAVREVDLVGRLGGDEFLVVCPRVPDAETVEGIGQRVAAALSRTMAISDDHLVRPRASIGVAWAPAGTDPTALVARADAAMYESKRLTRLPAQVAAQAADHAL